MIQGFSGGLLNRQLIYNLDLPSFQRDFAALKTLDHGTGPAITFTRASDATYFDANGVLQTASNDAPRFDHDPATGASRGLLIEEARTNLLTHSEQFDNAAWAKTNLITAGMANTDTSPAGTTTADKIIEDTNNGIHETRQSVSIATTGNHTYSVFAKAAGRNFATFYIRETANSGATYVSAGVDLSNGTISGTPVGTASVTSVGNGWYRIVLTASVDSGTRFWQVRLRQDASTTSYAGDGTSGILLWGAQLEAGAFPTSYIPTTSAAVARSADSAIVTPISSFYNQAEGTMLLEHDWSNNAESSIYAYSGMFQRDSDNYIVLGLYDIGTAITQVPTTDVLPSAGFTNSQSKIAYGYSGSAIALIRSGGSVNTDSLTFTASAADQLLIAGPFFGGATYSGHIRKIAYWPKRLTNTLLEQLTT